MSTVPVPAPRATIEDGGTLVRVSVPARRNVVAVLFIVAWLCAWFFGEKSAVVQLLASRASGVNGFLGFWLVGWSLGGVFAARAVLWMFFGREVLELRDGELVLRRTTLGLGRRRSYDLGAIKNLRADPWTRPTGRSSFEFAGGVGGAIAFDYGPKTIRCGGALDEAEARQIVDLFKQRNAQLRSG